MRDPVEFLLDASIASVARAPRAEVDPGECPMTIPTLPREMINDRRKDLVVSGGSNVEPREVGHTRLTRPQVTQGPGGGRIP